MTELIIKLKPGFLNSFERRETHWNMSVSTAVMVLKEGKIFLYLTVHTRGDNWGFSLFIESISKEGKHIEYWFNLL